MNYKPFDLQKALAGDRFARKSDMKEPDEWHYFKTLSENYPVVCVFDRNIRQYETNGEYDSLGVDSDDLIMLPKKKKKLWIGVCKNADSQGLHYTSHAVTEEDKHLIRDIDGRVLIEIEIEVDE